MRASKKPNPPEETQLTNTELAIDNELQITLRFPSTPVSNANPHTVVDANGCTDVPGHALDHDVEKIPNL